MRVVKPAVLAFGIFLSVAAGAAPLDVDTFETAQSALTLTFPPAGTTASSSAAGAGMLGGERDLAISLTAGVIAGNTMTAVVSSGFLSYSQDATIAGSATVQWDGTDGSAVLAPTGLGGVDLTVGGTQDALLLDTVFDDLPVDLTLTVYTDAGNASSLSMSLPGLIFAATQHAIPFASFTPSLGAGADFTDVGAVTLTAGSAVTAPDLVIDRLRTTALLSAGKTDALLVDNNSDTVANPGDTLRYTVVLTNSDDGFDAAATGVVFTDTPDTNTALVAGSVTTTQGSVTTGNGGGDSSVSVDVGTIADGASVTITFDVLVDNPLGVGVTEVSNQGTATWDGLAGLPTDDLDTPAVDDATLTPVVNLLPTVAVTLVDALLVDGDSDSVADPGDTLRYTAVIDNTGDAAATNVVYTLPGPANAALVVGSVTTTQGSVTTGNGGGDTAVAVAVGSLAAAGSVTITADVVVDLPLAAGVDTLSAQGQVSGDNISTLPTDDPDSVPADDATLTPLGGQAAFTLTLQDSATSPGPGDPISYLAILTNVGDQDAANTVFSQPAITDTALTVGSVTTSQGTVTTGNTAGDTAIEVAVGTLAGDGGSVTIGFDVTVADPLTDGTTEVSAQSSASADGLTAQPSDDPDTVADDDPTVTPLSILAIPVLGSTGLAVLALMLLGLAAHRRFGGGGRPGRR